MTSKLIKLIAVLALLAAACANSTIDAGPTTSVPATTQEPTPSTSEEPAPPTTPATSDDANPPSDIDPNAEPGTLAINLQPVNGVFIEGFEIGLRIETADGEILYASLWTDYIESLDNASLGRYYDTVLIQDVPVGTIVVMATVSIGAGPSPVTPDIYGALNCTLEVDVPSDGQANVEISFDSRQNCLSETTLT